MKKLANFTLHDQTRYVQDWKRFGYDLDPIPRAPLIQFESGKWTEDMIFKATFDAMNQIIDEGFAAILIGGLSNCMCYAWYIANLHKMEVVMARSPRIRDNLTGKPMFILAGYSKMLDIGDIAIRVIGFTKRR